MRAYALLALLLAALLFLFFWWFLRTPPQQVARVLRRGGLALAIGIVVFLAATGRLHWIFALLGALIPIALRLLRVIQMLPLPLLQRLMAGVKQARAGPRAGGGQRSEVETRFLRMTLDHDSGEMSGEVIEGRFKGRSLDELVLGELLELRDECRGDDPSAAVLESYLDRMHPDWRDAAEAEHGPGSASAAMTEQDAREILGLKPGASKEEIVAAHRRLIQKLHPDRGGSDYLAAQINEAKDVLLASID
jgi:hypothetical protein